MLFLIFYFSSSCAINGKDNFQKANIRFEEAVLMFSLLTIPSFALLSINKMREFIGSRLNACISVLTWSTDLSKNKRQFLAIGSYKLHRVHEKESNHYNLVVPDEQFHKISTRKRFITWFSSSLSSEM